MSKEPLDVCTAQNTMPLARGYFFFGRISRLIISDEVWIRGT